MSGKRWPQTQTYRFLLAFVFSGLCNTVPYCLVTWLPADICWSSWLACSVSSLGKLWPSPSDRARSQPSLMQQDSLSLIHIHPPSIAHLDAQLLTLWLLCRIPWPLIKVMAGSWQLHCPQLRWFLNSPLSKQDIMSPQPHTGTEKDLGLATPYHHFYSVVANSLSHWKNPLL